MKGRETTRNRDGEREGTGRKRESGTGGEEGGREMEWRKTGEEIEIQTDRQIEGRGEREVIER